MERFYTNNTNTIQFLTNSSSNVEMFTQTYFSTTSGTGQTYAHCNTPEKDCILCELESRQTKEDKVARPSADLNMRIKDFQTNISDRDWRLSFHELVGLGLRESVDAPNITRAESSTTELFKDYVTESVKKALKKEKGSKSGLLKWARKDRTEETKNRLGWATRTEAHKEFIVKFLEDL